MANFFCGGGFFGGSSRFPSLVLAAKISHLLHFVAKISHPHCSSIIPLVSGFVFMVFIECSIVFIGLSMVFFNFSMIFFNFFMVFFNCAMFFFRLFDGFFHFAMVSSIFQWCSSIVLCFSSICAWFSFSFHLFLLIVPEF